MKIAVQPRAWRALFKPFKRAKSRSVQPARRASVQNVSPTRGRLRGGLNGAQRLNGLNGLNKGEK